MPLIDLTGVRCGRLVVLGRAGVNAKRRSTWYVRCDCGVEKIILGDSIRNQSVRSCGCLRHENKQATTHGFTNTPEYKAWQQMKQRCFNPVHGAYKNYGGRGITVYEEWINDFQKFYDYIGPRPSDKHSLDRIDNDKGYEPGNVRWATIDTQNHNKRSSR